ncbi:MAG: adenylyltransferase/cytidyltransferase family protein, partial [Clostridiales bacterium]|nr:adenylyltransferase/cytidyltransferase family protein [Clostridiales bacterium]
MSILLFPGSFDPFTLGHCDIAKRASRQCDKLVVAIMGNSAKRPAFSTEDRVYMAKESLKDHKNIEVIS